MKEQVKWQIDRCDAIFDTQKDKDLCVMSVMKHEEQSCYFHNLTGGMFLIIIILIIALVFKCYEGNKCNI